MSKRCVGCMKLKEKSPVCEHCGYNEHVPNESHQLPIGTVLQGRYQIGKVLGQGGFGITYIGWDLSLETVVAIKEFYPGSIVNRDCSVTRNVACNGSHVDELFTLNRDRFLREARILAKLSHVPGIVRVQNLFGENNTAYIVMEYVEGIDLKHYIRMQGRVLTVEETFAVMRPVMYALSRVHEAELVHRDISPDNIMIQKDGSIVLLDFGAAREVANADVHKDLTRSTQTILKHGFAPIEQYRSRGNLGPWTDIYALCATMYYCLTGKVPSEAPERVIGEDNVNWRQIPGLTETQIAALEQGLAMIPEKRIQSVKELYQALYGQRPTTVAQQPVKPEPPTEKTVEEPVKEPEKVPEERTAEYPTHTVALEEPAPKAKEPIAPAKSVVMETKQRKKKPVWMIVAAVLVVLVTTFIIKITAKDNQINSFPAAPTYASDAWESNILMYLPHTQFKGIHQSKISTVTFLDTTKNAPESVWDVSERRDKSVIAWAEESKELYDIYIAADGGINAEKACSYLFSTWNSLNKISFNSSFHTEKAIDMTNMFNECNSLISLDLSNFHTDNVTSMDYMFFGCSNLKELDLSSFDTSNVTTMSSMFSDCSNLKELDLSSFDTSNVIFMTGMFYDCSNLKNLDLRNFNTSNLKDVRTMFYRCKDPNNFGIDFWDTSNITVYDNFMEDGKTINSRPWEELFQ